MPASPDTSAVGAASLPAFGDGAEEDPELYVALEQDLGHGHMVTQSAD